ncbi:hypothetical protein Scep_022827 [Stephania cephalantha]|uniref:Uncharacterized protein n=1 Tax=Stephania cephalantha TaxID=152367 RepID=A0AAP0FH92_9MAGN
MCLVAPVSIHHPLASETILVSETTAVRSKSVLSISMSVTFAWLFKPELSEF